VIDAPHKMTLRLPPDLLDRAKRLAEAESISVDQLVTIAVAEKIARLEAEAFYQAREGHSGAASGWRALEGMGRNSPPVQGDELRET
jgi:predicted transcriptional regulator